jgi:hypothetical protein
MKRKKRVTFVVICLLLMVGLFLFLGLWPDSRSQVRLLAPNELVAGPHIWKITGRILAVLFPPESVSVSADIFSSSKFSKKSLEKNLRREGARRDETSVWLLSPAEVEKLTAEIGALKPEELISRPKIVVSEFNTGSFFIGSTVSVNGTNTSVGVDLEVTPRRKRSSTELTLAFSWTELHTNRANVFSLRTNASVAAQIRVADGDRVLVLSERKEEPPVCLWIRSLRAP